jgi:hypothetical protein
MERQAMEKVFNCTTCVLEARKTTEKVNYFPSVCSDLLTHGQNASATSTHYLCIDLVARSEQKYTVNKRVSQFELL